MSNRNQTATYDNPLVLTHTRAVTALNSAAEKGRFRVECYSAASREAPPAGWRA